MISLRGFFLLVSFSVWGLFPGSCFWGDGSAGVSGVYGQASCGTIYVTPSGSGPFGTVSQPTDLFTAMLIYQTDTSRRRIAVLEGTYTYTNKIVLPGPVVIEGGYRILNGDWVKRSDAVSRVTINPQVESDTVLGVTVGHYIGIAADGVSRFALKDLTLDVLPGGGSGQTSGYGRTVYGVYVSNSSDFYFSRLQVSAGDGSDGADGINGANGLTGGNGGGGGTGDDDGAGCGQGGFGGAGGGGVPQFSGPGNCGNAGGNAPATLFRQGGTGGAGGAGGADDGSGRGGAGGVGGIGGNGAVGGIAGGGGNSGDPGSDGSDGSVGANGLGLNGTNYNAGLRPSNTAFGRFFRPGLQAMQGGSGAGGSGGGGGGGGGGQSCTFCDDGSGAGGGGGGGGGEGGEGGLGGFGGGGSFCVYAYQSTVGATLVDAVLNPGQPGFGGDGGNGGMGGPGGLGLGGGTGSGNSCSEVGCGGDGADGGDGAPGGRGQDGANGLVNDVVGISQVGVSIPNPVTVSVWLSAGCTNSEIQISKSTGAWGLLLGAGYVPDLGPGLSSYSNLSDTALVWFSQPGFQGLSVNGSVYQGYVSVLVDRPLPVIDPLPASLCTGSVIPLGSSTAGAAYDWVVYDSAGSPANPLASFSVQNPGNFTPSGNGTFYVRLRVEDVCCGWSIPVYDSVVVGVPPVVNLGPDRTVCGSAFLDAGPGYASYSWSNGANGQVIQVNLSGSYSVTVTDGGGCSDSDTILVNVFPTAIFADAGPDSVFCDNDSILLGGLPSGGGGNAPYLWSWLPVTGLGQPSAANPRALPGGPTQYVLTVTDRNGCEAKDTVNVAPVAAPVVNAGRDTTICACDSAVLGGLPVVSGGVGPYAFRWGPTIGIANFMSGNTAARVCSTIEYVLEVSDQSGCVDFDTVRVTAVDTPVVSFSTTALGGGGYNFFDFSSGPVSSWSWDFGDGGVSSLQNPSYIYQRPGNYLVCLTVGNACGLRSRCDTLRVIVASVDVAGADSGTGGVFDDRGLRVWPNPVVNGVLKISLSAEFVDGAERFAEVLVWDLMGRVVRKGTLQRKGDGFVGQLDLIGVEGGIYFVGVGGDVVKVVVK